MALTREQKKKIIDELKEKIDKQKAMVFVDFTGTKVKDISRLREEMKKDNCEFKVAKKTLLKIALKDRGVELPQEPEGEIGVGFGFGNQISPFKILNKFSKETGNLKILGGLVEKEFIGEDKAIALAELPSKQELLAKLVGSIKAPISGFINVLQGNLRNFVYVLGAIKK
ncbi:MAG: 50S ribosomal protein L10 [Candidatus Nealsonbacteria bacterium CG_4_10_14_0_8_um_filter_37_14]|uniref:Large ribosomal subunit protein uL10 n=1 Tax=Candidatus Nealsonbacteria bacterium CG_4_10_14_0_8_um_filter_37_14 TaxID=1974684 RepID=A0A2M7R7S7_9BACT|nr:MAG: 50S ribosomal protein L10 [Candidatus Nealsonbacteria bacterium CG11_big_fil_rev_8_21_14_0_20_37_68]PIW92270.1 MAG: 50S ribosomal protein L10 [Candidatus Nealsonbacteria bacterium CG_4_8_14_3_um_filter_37_23]PIY89232.1 MAG: 50S ribosomal protein L10 [Candidatus Nealsonbacteria bacterium CG_4_10_14_0_8_um_filter_37_14]